VSMKVVRMGTNVRKISGRVTKLLHSTTAAKPNTNHGTGAPRYTGGLFELYEGIPFLVVLIGVFALAEAFVLVERNEAYEEGHVSDTGERLTIRSALAMLPTYLRGSFIGTVVGAIPGAGANIAGWL